MTKHQLIGIWLGLLCVLSASAWSVWTNEQILAHGKIVRLKLAPVDPRSLMQGDYMALQYALATEVRQATKDTEQAQGYLIAQLDEQKLASFVRVESLQTRQNAAPLAANEIAIYFRLRKNNVQIATNAFFFQEGSEPVFRDAQYGEFRVAANGEPRLTALLGKQFQRLGDNRY